LKGRLPWQGLKAQSKKEKYQKIKDKKMSTSVEKLCQNCPVEFANYLAECRNMKLLDRPDYSSMKSMFRRLFEKSGYKLDQEYDWMTAS